MSYLPPTTLDCQQCGNIIRVLDAREAQMVADAPYNFITRCARCIVEDSDEMAAAAERAYGRPPLRYVLDPATGESRFITQAEAEAIKAARPNS